MINPNPEEGTIIFDFACDFPILVSFNPEARGKTIDKTPQNEEDSVFIFVNGGKFYNSVTAINPDCSLGATYKLINKGRMTVNVVDEDDGSFSTKTSGSWALPFPTFIDGNGLIPTPSFLDIQGTLTIESDGPLPSPLVATKFAGKFVNVCDEIAP